jgi:hypothetical protein
VDVTLTDVRVETVVVVVVETGLPTVVKTVTVIVNLPPPPFVGPACAFIEV